MKWSKEEDKYLKENYTILDMDEIAKKLGRSKASITQRATIKFGLKKNNGLPNNVSVEDLIKSYKELGSTRKVALRFGIHKSKIGYYLKKAGVTNKPIRYSHNETFFDKDTPESFYWAGFMAADGCIKEKSNSKIVSIGLAIKDYNHLQKFKDTVKFTGPISTKTDNKSVEINIYSIKLAQALKRFNVVPRKTHIYDFPEWLEDHPLVNHFMRGYNDGDGGFYLRDPYKKGRKIKQLWFEIRGNQHFLQIFNKILARECEISYKEPFFGVTWRTASGGNRRTIKIRDFLYKDSTPEIRMGRKYDIAFCDYIESLPGCFGQSIIATSMTDGSKLYFNTIKEAAESGFTRSSVSDCCRGIRSYHKGYTWRYAT